MYYGTQSITVGSAKFATRMFWVVVEDTYYLAVEAPVEFIYNFLKTISDFAVPAVAIPMGAMLSATSYLPIPLVVTGSSLALAGEVVVRGTVTATEYLTQYVVRPVVVSGLLTTGIVLESGMELIKTTRKFTLVVVAGTGEFMFYTFKPVLVGSYVVWKYAAGTVVRTADKIADGAVFITTNAVNASIWTALFGYSAIATTVDVVGGAITSGFRYVQVDVPVKISSFSFTRKYDEILSTITNVNFDKLPHFAEKYVGSDEFKRLLKEYNFTENDIIGKEIKSHKAYIYLKSARGDRMGVMFNIIRQKERSLINIAFGFDKKYMKNINNKKPSNIFVLNNLDNFIKNYK